MAKLIIEGEQLQLLKIEKAYRLLEARKVVKCYFDENKIQEGESSPESNVAKVEIIEQKQQYKPKGRPAKK